MFEKIGFTSVTFRKLNIDKVVKIALNNNMDYIEWGSDSHVKFENNIENNINMLKAVGCLPCSSYGTYYVVGENNIHKFKTLCYIAGQLGANIIRVWLGNKSSKNTSIAEITALHNEVQWMADIAKQASLTIAFEFHKNTLNDSAKSCLAFVKHVNRDNVRTYWQPFGEHESDMRTLAEICYYMVGVHVFQWSTKGVRKPLKRGVKVWKEYFGLLKDRHINPIIVMEFVKNDSPRQFAKDVAILRNMLAEFKVD